jgi:hypothetical protein
MRLSCRTQKECSHYFISTNHSSTMSEVASIDETQSVEDCLDNQAIDHFITCKLQIEPRQFVLRRLASRKRPRRPVVLACTGRQRVADTVLLHLLYVLDLKSSQNKEDTLVLLTNVSSRFDRHDEAGLDREMREGTAAVLARNLHEFLILWSLKGKNYYRKSFEHSRGLQVSALCRALDMILQCSDRVLAECMPKLKDDLLPSLPRILKIYAQWEGDSIIRLITIASTLRIIRKVSPFVSEAATPLVGALLSILDGHFPPDIRVDATCAAVSFLGKSCRNEELVKLMEQKASVIISILSTAALAASNESLVEILHSLSSLASCPTLGAKMARRRCAIFMAVKNLSHKQREVRGKSLDLCHAFLGHRANARPARTVHESNLDLIVGGLMKAVSAESDPRLQLSQIRIMGSLIIRDDIATEQKWNVMTLLRAIAKSEGCDGPTMEAQLCYLHSAATIGFTEEVVATVADFTTSEYAKVRNKALGLVKEISFWHPHAARLLFDSTDLLENFSLIISHGSDEDCADAIHASKVFVSDEANHQFFCIDAGFVASLVRLVTTEPVANRPAFINGVDTIITLMSSSVGLPYFLPFIEILPWLVTFANRTSDEEIKEIVVSTVLRFSTALLALS